MRLSRFQADISLALVTAIWGATFVIVKQALGGIPPFAFLALRFDLALLVLVLVFRRRLVQGQKGAAVAGLIIGAFLFAGYAFQTIGLQYTTASKAGFITGLSVVLVPALSAAILKKRPSPALALGILTATLGLAVLSLNDDLIPTPGDLLILLCALSFAFQILAVSRYGSDHDPAVLTTVQIGIVAVLSHLASAGWETWPEMVSGPVWQAVFITGIPATALALLVQNSLQRFTTPTHAALVFAAEPVFAAVFAYWLGGETFSLRGYIGAALMLSGMVLAEITPSGGNNTGIPTQV